MIKIILMAAGLILVTFSSPGFAECRNPDGTSLALQNFDKAQNFYNQRDQRRIEELAEMQREDMASGESTTVMDTKLQRLHAGKRNFNQCLADKAAELRKRLGQAPPESSVLRRHRRITVEGEKVEARPGLQVTPLISKEPQTQKEFSKHIRSLTAWIVTACIKGPDETGSMFRDTDGDREDIEDTTQELQRSVQKYDELAAQSEPLCKLDEPSASSDLLF
jgi:hypothetical protein